MSCIADLLRSQNNLWHLFARLQCGWTNGGEFVHLHYMANERRIWTNQVAPEVTFLSKHVGAIDHLVSPTTILPLYFVKRRVSLPACFQCDAKRLSPSLRVLMNLVQLFACHLWQSRLPFPLLDFVCLCRWWDRAIENPTYAIKVASWQSCRVCCTWDFIRLFSLS